VEPAARADGLAAELGLGRPDPLPLVVPFCAPADAPLPAALVPDRPAAPVPDRAPALARDAARPRDPAPPRRAAPARGAAPAWGDAPAWDPAPVPPRAPRLLLRRCGRRWGRLDITSAPRSPPSLSEFRCSSSPSAIWPHDRAPGARDAVKGSGPRPQAKATPPAIRQMGAPIPPTKPTRNMKRRTPLHVYKGRAGLPARPIAATSGRAAAGEPQSVDFPKASSYDGIALLGRYGGEVPSGHGPFHRLWRRRLRVPRRRVSLGALSTPEGSGCQ